MTGRAWFYRATEISQQALVHQCQITAQRMSMLYALNSPEFFDRALFDQFINQLRLHDVVGTSPDDKLVYDTQSLEAIAADAKMVLAEQIRNSILQVVHR